MTEPSLAVQIAFTAALQGHIGAKVFDRVSAAEPMPYVRTGDDQVVPTPADCLEAAVEVRSTLHVFSTLYAGRREAKTIAGAIVARLAAVDLDLGPDWALVEVRHTGTRLLDEPDGAIHAVLTFSTLADPVP